MSPADNAYDGNYHASSVSYGYKADAGFFTKANAQMVETSKEYLHIAGSEQT